MRIEYPLVPLGDLFDFASGLSKPASQFGFGNPFVTFKDVFDNFYLPADLKSLANTSRDEVEKYSVRRGDVFLTRTSETLADLGMSSVALKDYPMATFNGFTKRLRPKAPDQLHPEYLAYAFRSPGFRQSMHALSTMSTRASLNNEMLSRLQIPVPRLERQRLIASILHPLDLKAELSERINQTLEAMTRAIFLSWFVDFDPVRAKAEGRPTGLSSDLDALFPSRFEPSETGEIPMGWEFRPLDQIADFRNGLALQKYPPADGGALAVIKIAQLRSGNTIGADLASADLPEDYIVSDGDILFSWSGSLECVQWSGGPGALNQHLFKVASNRYPKWLYKGWIDHHLPSFRHTAAGKATTMGHIQRHHLSEALVAVPGLDGIEKMGRVIAPLFEATLNNSLQARTLASMRDTLLPKLISGDLRVEYSEKFAGRDA